MWDSFFDTYMWDIWEVLDWFLLKMQDFLSFFFDSEFSWMFNLAFLPFILMFAFDILITFIFSIRFRELRVFNVLSPKSWRMLNDIRKTSLPSLNIGESKNRVREFVVRRFVFTPFVMRLKYVKAKSGDLIYSKDGLRSIYGGVKLSADGKTILYKYSTNNGVYYSSLNPLKWAMSNGSQRMNSVKHKTIIRKGDKYG